MRVVLDATEELELSVSVDSEDCTYVRLTDPNGASAYIRFRDPGAAGACFGRFGNKMLELHAKRN